MEQKAFAEGKKWGNVRCAASSEPAQFTCLPPLSREAFRENADYVYLCENETIHGTAFSHLPDTGGRPVVSDQSSLFLSRPCRVSDYGLIFASAQKNAGPAGLTLVILREDLMGPPPDPKTPSYLRYDLHAQADSLYNTPNCWAIYVCGKIFRHLLETGGLEAAAARNREKSGLLYDFLDNSSLFHPIAAKKDRSSTNIPFTTGSRALDEAAIAAAEQAGLTGLRGHRSLGGLRASLYNAMPKAGVEALVAFLRDFEEIPG